MTDEAPRHVLVLYEPTRRGVEVLHEAAGLARSAAADLTVAVVAVAEPVDTGCCDLRSVYWNGVVEDLARSELAQARRLLRNGLAADFTVARGRTMPVALAAEAERRDADVIVLPSAGRGMPWSRRRRLRQVQRRTARRVLQLH